MWGVGWRGEQPIARSPIEFWCVFLWKTFNSVVFFSPGYSKYIFTCEAISENCRLQPPKLSLLSTSQYLSFSHWALSLNSDFYFLDWVVITWHNETILLQKLGKGCLGEQVWYVSHAPSYWQCWWSKCKNLLIKLNFIFHSDSLILLLKELLRGQLVQ